MATTHITDHVDRAIARLRQQYRDKPNIEAWLRILVEPIQRLEDAIWQLLTMRGIDEAVGVQLDALGKIVGQPRNGRNDDVYRRFIRAKISVNKSKGTAEDILLVTNLVLDDETITLRLSRTGTCELRLWIGGAAVSTELQDLLVDYFLNKTIAAGVRIVVTAAAEPFASRGRWGVSEWGESDALWGHSRD